MVSRAKIYNAPEEKIDRYLGLIIAVAAIMHLVVIWGGLFWVPKWLLVKPRPPQDILVVKILDDLPAPGGGPAALADSVREEPKPSGRPESNPPPPDTGREVPTPPSEVIDLGPKEPQKVIWDRKTDPPPKPEVKPEPKPNPKPKPNPSLQEQAKIGHSLAQIADKVAANKSDEAILAAVGNIASQTGQGDGQSSRPSSPGGQAGQAGPREKYLAAIVEITQSNWTRPPDALLDFNKGQPLTLYSVEVSPTGEILRHGFMKKSGQEHFDLSVERAIQKSKFPPFPPDFFELTGGQPEVIGLRFTPQGIGRGF